MHLRRGIKPGTIVTDYPVGEKRPYMIKVYGGRLVAEGLIEKDIVRILDEDASPEFFAWFADRFGLRSHARNTYVYDIEQSTAKLVWNSLIRKFHLK